MTKPLMWRTRDGTTLRIRDMGDSHLLNSIRYLRRTHQQRCWALAISADRYAMTAPDGASDAAAEAAAQAYELGDEQDDEAVSEMSPVFGHLLNEAHRRRLSADRRPDE
mgnify:CR=1 FL=1